MSNSKIIETTLQCPECGNKTRIWRKICRQKKVGHIKHMWCPHCEKVVGFIEVKDMIPGGGWSCLSESETPL